MTARVEPWNVTPEAVEHIHPIEVPVVEAVEDAPVVSDELIVPIAPMKASAHVTADADELWARSYANPPRWVWWLFVYVCIVIPAAILLTVVVAMVVKALPGWPLRGVVVYVCATAVLMTVAGIAVRVARSRGGRR